MKRIVLMSALAISSRALASTSNMACSASYGQQAFTINIESENNKITSMIAFDEAERSVTYTAENITESFSVENLAAVLQPQNYTLRGSKANDTISVVIPAQNPLAQEFSAFVVAYSDTLKLRTPVAAPVKATCKKF